PLATIKIKGSQTSVLADDNGNFKISAAANATLQITATGFAPLEVVASSTSLSISLKQQIEEIDNIVVTAQGIRKKSKEIGYSYAKVSTEELTVGRAPRLTQALAGKVSGLAIYQVNNSVDPAVKVVLRGYRSMTGNNEALVVLDGIQTTQTVLPLINPNDIESVTILKGGQAATLYGAEGVNGAIVINTKKGNKGKSKVSYSSSVNFEEISFLPQFQDKYGSGSHYAPSYTTIPDYKERMRLNWRPYENQQYGDPLYFSQGSALYTGDYSAILAENTKSLNYSPLDYIHDHGIAGFLQKFIAGGIYHVLDQAAKLSLPYLFYMLPFGILFSFRAFDQNPKYIRANWIVILITLGSFVTYFAVVQERRLIFHTVPFLIIFAVIPIQRLVEYGFSTFSFSKKQKNLVLTIILIIAFILALLFTTRYQPVDVQLENEKLEFAKYVLSHYEGKIVDTGDSLQTLRYVILTEKQDFKQYLTKNDDQFSKTDKLDVINLYASSLNDFINVSKQYDVKYLIVNKNSITQEWYPYMDGVYDDSNPYLKKVFDPTDLGFRKLDVRVFQIDYSEFDRISK
ncbi:MAG: hypothetical protein EB166_09270, partial [Thaumarchaeota archaeon]|nr:hypothetical protein [Nitrososphaerota archaeon]